MSTSTPTTVGTRPKFSFSLGVGATLILIAAIVIVAILAGTWVPARIAGQRLEAELKRFGSSLALQAAPQLYEHAEREDKAMLRTLSDEILREEMLRYVIVTNRQGEVLISNSRLSWRPMSMPTELRASVCRTADAVIRARQIDNEELYDIAVRLRPLDAATTPSPAEVPSEACAGALHLGVSRQPLLDYQQSARSWVWGVSMFSLLSAVVGYYLLRSKLVNPLLTLSEALQKIPDDECRHMLEPIANYGEIGTLKSALLHANRTLGLKMTDLQRHQSRIHEHSGTLLQEHDQQLATLQQQDGALHKLSEQARKNMQSFGSLSASTQHAVETATSSLKNTDDMKIAVDATMDSIEHIRRQVTTNTERIIELGEKIAQISNVVKMINTIAAQTKLIAFNAGIEAAGAGEAGGRFSIVAAEVRRLADTVVESVEEIKESVSSIQTATSELILSSETGIRNVNQGVLQIAAARETLQRMTEALKENSASLNEVLESIQLQETQQRIVVNGLKDMLLQCDDALERIRRSHGMAGELSAIVGEME